MRFGYYGGIGSSLTGHTSKDGRSVPVTTSIRIWRLFGWINEVAANSSAPSDRSTGPAFGRPVDRLRPVSISIMDPGPLFPANGRFRRDDPTACSGFP